MTAPADARGLRIDALDTLRGVAILMVLVSHYLPPRLSLPAATPHLEAVGRGGVILFFLLSGYLMFRNLERQSPPVFVLRRLFKILPSYWLNLGIILALDVSIVDAPHLPAANYAADFFMISDVLHLQPVSPVYWTLLVETKFYALIALQYAVLRNRFVPGVIVALLGASLINTLVRGHMNMLLWYFPVFYVGIFIYRAEQAGWGRKSWLALAVVTAAVSGTMPVVLDVFPVWTAVYVAAGTIAFVLCLKLGLGHRAMSFVGRTSYNNYLFHGLAGVAVGAALGPSSSAWGTVLHLAVWVAVAIAFAAFLYGTIEQPLVRFGRQLERLIGADHTRLPPVPAVP